VSKAHRCPPFTIHFDDPIASMMQSGVEHALRRTGTESSKCHQHVVMLATNDLVHDAPGPARSWLRRPSQEDFPRGQWDVLRLYYAIMRARFNHNMRLYRKLKEKLKFSLGDPEWIAALVEFLEIFEVPGGYKIPYVRWAELDDGMIDGLDLPLKIALIGDWGTGTKAAENILEQAVALEPDIIIHLGDVYYAGTQREYQERVIDLVKAKAKKPCGKRIPFLNIPGNHDMYSGGKPYYDAFSVLNKDVKDNAGSSNWQQQHSFFGLRDKDKRWQILAMDTAYFDHDPFTVSSVITKVHPSEEEWLMHHTAAMSENGGKTILLSHHQPFSSLVSIGNPMHKKPADFYVNPNLLLLNEKLKVRGDVAAWFWGHEHRWLVYEEHRGLKKGRCIGHGAIPVFVNEAAYADYQPSWRTVIEAFSTLVEGSAAPPGVANFLALVWRVLTGYGGDIPARALADGEKIKPSTSPIVDRGVEIQPDPGCLGVAYRNGFAFLSIDQNADAKVHYYETGKMLPIHCEDL
jgi:hypothetical protein